MCAYKHESPVLDEIRSISKEMTELAAKIKLVQEAIDVLLDFKRSDAESLPPSSPVGSSEILQIDGNLTLNEDDIILKTDASMNPRPSQKYLSFTCETCGMSFSEYDVFTEHDGYQYCCAICEICFETKVAANEHEEDFHPEYPGIEQRHSKT